MTNNTKKIGMVVVAILIVGMTSLLFSFFVHAERQYQAGRVKREVSLKPLEGVITADVHYNAVSGLTKAEVLKVLGPPTKIFPQRKHGTIWDYENQVDLETWLYQPRRDNGLKWSFSDTHSVRIGFKYGGDTIEKILYGWD